MSNFSKSSVIDETPGPNAYNVDPSILNQDPNKHYGFLEKSSRFRSASKGIPNTNKDTLNDGVIVEESEVVLKTSTSSSTLNAPRRGENEQIQKLKKELERVEFTYEKQLALHEKEMNILGDRCHKLDFQLQAAIKEKSSLATSSVAKDREIDDLKHRQGLLRSKLDKAEKASVVLKEKHAQSEILQKKVDDLSKQQERFKQSSKNLQESETLKSELKSLRARLDQLAGEKQSLTTMVDQLKSDRKIYKAKNLELNSAINTVRDEWHAKEAKLKEESKELGKRLNQQQETITAQKNDFTKTAQSLNMTISELDNTLNLERSSFDHQKQAYLGRINQLETDLDVIERDLLEKDRQLQSVRSKLQDAQSKIKLAEEESSNVQTELDTLLKEFSERKASYESAISEKIAELEQCNTEKSLQQSHFETLLVSLQSTIDKFQKDQALTDSRHAKEIKEREDNISTITKQLRSKDKEIEHLNMVLSQKVSEYDLIEKQHSTEVMNSQMKISDLQKCAENLEQSLMKSEAGRENLKISTSEQRAKIEELESTLQTTTLDLNRMNSVKFEFQQKVIELQGMLESSKHQNSESETQLRREISELYGKLEASFQECDSLNYQKQLCENTIAQLEREMASQAETARKENNSLKETINFHISKIDLLNSELRDKESEHLRKEEVFKTDVAVLEESVLQSRIEIEELSLKLRQSSDSQESLEKLYRNEEESYASHRQRYEAQIADKDTANKKLREKIMELTKQMEEQALSRELITATSKRAQTELEFQLSQTEEKLLKANSEANGARELLREAYVDIDNMEARMRMWEEKACSAIDSSLEYQSIADEHANVILGQSYKLEELCEDITLLNEENKSQKESIADLEALVSQALAQNSIDLAQSQSEDGLISQLHTQSEYLELYSGFIKLKSDLENSVVGFCEKEAEVSKLQTSLVIADEKRSVYRTYISELSSISNLIWDSLESTEESLDREMDSKDYALQTKAALELKLSQSEKHLEEYTSEQNGLTAALRSENIELAAEIASQSSQIAILSLECKSIAEKLESAVLKSADFELQLGLKTQECAELSSNLAESNSAKEAVAGMLSALENEFQDFKLRTKEMHIAETADLQKQLDIMNDKVLNESIAFAKLNDSYLIIQKEKFDLFHLNGELTDNCNRFEEQINTLQQKIKTLQSNHEEQYQHLEHELSKSQVYVREKENVIADLQQSLVQSQKFYDEEIQVHLFEMKNLSESHNEAMKNYESKVADLEKRCADIKSDFDNFQSKADEAAAESAGREENLQARVIDLEISENFKDDRIKSLELKQSEIILQKEEAISDMRASLSSAEKQYQDALKLLQNEKAQIMKTALSEKAAFSKKIAVLNEIVEKQSLDIAALQSRLSESQESLASMKNSAKIEFGNLTNENLKLTKKLDLETKNWEKMVRDFTSRLAEKSSQVLSLETKCSESENIIERSEIRLSNEVSNRELMIKNLESKLRENTKALDLARIECSTIKADFQKFKEHSGATIEAKVEAQVQAATSELLRENSELEQIVKERADDEQALIHEINSLKIKLAEAIQTQANEKENFDLQLQLLEQRGKLQKSEIKKIGDLNAELFGHSNTRQKIKHVAQLKEENMTLREQNLSLSRERDIARRKVMVLQRDVESFKQLGISSSKKTSRVGRSALESNRILDGGERQKPQSKPNFTDDHKENVSVNLGNGGISFVIE